MDIESVIYKVKGYNPTIYKEACEDYPSLMQGDVVIDFNYDTCLVYENGKYQIFYKEWLGDFDNPIPVIQAILMGYCEIDETGKYPRLYIEDIAGYPDPVLH